MGHPGALPTINRSAIEKIILAGLALNCKIKNYSRFDRKSYFYPDLPKGYQISQFDFPICKDGYLDVHLDDGTIKRIRINRIHMEEDTARLIHEGSSTLVDFNRSSVPLMELVTEPDINSAEEAKKFAQELQLILKYNDISGANMEKGQMRCEVNISLSDTEKLGTKVEIKNLNSFKAIEKSIEYEIKRQKEIIEKGGKVKQETRGWYDDKQITMDQREKEDAFEYRYFPDPDLPPLNISDEEIEKIKKRLVELPEQKRKRFKEEYNLDDKSIEFYINEPSLADYFEKVISELDCWKKHKNCEKDSIKVCSNYIITDLQAIIKNDPDFISIDERITPENFAELISMLENKGKTNSFMFLVGQVMAKSKGKITPQKAEEIIKKLI
ncbi:MAG: aspartyl/glutamyl-tRNA(Asn/Gln) amidotransferase subunit B [Parcubacteria bacterium 34_609]|nr:MAG: aspartyl/glutamyl-tRNA(Asn/Gln) amidotransferase subunit B [Parcubacteria bacterium 34_609]